MILTYQTQIQLLDDWCWAAVASSIAFRYNNASPWTQSALAGALLDNSCSVIDKNNAGNAPSVCHQRLELEKALAHTQNFAWLLQRQLSFSELTDQLNKGFPVCCQIYWSAYNQSHFVTIYGYDGSDAVIGDPDYGACSIDFNLLAGTGYRTGKWIRTYGTQPAQQT